MTVFSLPLPNPRSPVTNVLLDRPIFIVGCPRSGTTLLQRMLSSHSGVAIAAETHFIRRFWQQRQQYGPLEHDDNYQTLLNHITQIPEFKEMHLVPAHFIEQAMTIHRSYANLFNLLLKLFQTHQGTPRVGEKTPHHLRHLDTLIQFSPDAYIIHIIRDPRAVACSWQTVPWSTGSLAGDTAIWKTDMAIMNAYNSQIQKHIISVTYENLIAAPAQWLAKICDFIEIPFEPTMVNYHTTQATAVNLQREPWKKNITHSVNTAIAHKWQDNLSSQQIMGIELIVWREMQTLGYNSQTSQLILWIFELKQIAKTHAKNLKQTLKKLVQHQR